MFNKDQSQEIEALPEYTDFLQTVAPRFEQYIIILFTIHNSTSHMEWPSKFDLGRITQGNYLFEIFSIGIISYT